MHSQFLSTAADEVVVASSFPDISPDFDAPFFDGFIQIASWVLAVVIVLVYIALVLAIAALAFKGIMPDRARAVAGAALPWVIGAAIVLSIIGGLFAWILGFDFGFGSNTIETDNPNF